MSTDRAPHIQQFLDTAGWHGALARPLAGDASFRRYYRVQRNGCRAVLMDAPPDREDVRPFIAVSQHLQTLGLSAPCILAADIGQGFLLLEDFGDDTFSRLLASGAEERALYRLATDVLVFLHRMPSEQALPRGLPAYDRNRLLDEALLLVDWYLPAMLESPCPDDVRSEYVSLWSHLLDTILQEPPTLVLRDFHVDNLMRLSQRDGIATCGLLDFQDAVSGPAAYDLMSLLEDARRDVSDRTRAEMMESYCAAMGIADPERFRRIFATLAAQRHCKVIGIFTRLCRRDGKQAYLVHIPRVFSLLTRALEHSALADLKDWFDRNLPPCRRQIPSPAPVVTT